MPLYPAHFEKFFSKLKNLKQVPRGWEASCPCHESHHDDPHSPDQHPSLGVLLREDGWLTPTCWVGCSREEIVKSLGLTIADIGPSRPERVERFGKGIIETTYPYHDENGKELFQVVRFKPKDFRQRRQDGKGGYIWSLTGCRRVLYRLPELLATPNKQVFLVEGEKDVESLRKLGALATCNPLGAGKWEDDYTETLRGRGVVLIPDHDAPLEKTKRRPGWDHVQLVAKKLIGAAAFVRVLQLDIPEGQDVSDWIEAGGTYEQLKALAKASPVIQHPENLPEYIPHGGHVAPTSVQARRVRKIKLTAEELSSAAHKGVMRHIHLIKRKDRSHDDFKAWSVQIELACAEQAARKATHRYFVGAVGTYQDGTRERLLQVKFHPTEDSHIKLTNSDKDDDLFVFVTGVAPCYSVHGWIAGAEGKLESHKNNDGIYLVPKERLHDVRELPPELDAEGWDE